MSILASLVLLFSGFTVCIGIPPVATSENALPSTLPSNMERSFEMDGKGCNVVQWTVHTESQELTMVVTSVPAADWVAIGLSEFGGMKGADIAMIKMTTYGDFVVEDLFSDEYQMPRKDAVQNVELLSAFVDDHDRISAVIRRPLRSCDEDDLDVTQDRQSIVCASGQSNSAGEPVYHGRQRSKASVNLMVDEDLLFERRLQLDFNASPFNLVDDVVVAQQNPNTATSPFPVDFQMPRVSVNKTKRTTYLCHFFEMPMDMNIVGYEAVWNNGTTIENEPAPQWLHHQDLRYCPDVSLIDPSHRSGAPFDCGDSVPPCHGILSHAQSGRIPTPVGVHLPLKGKRTYMLLVHYDNPFQHQLEDDTSGIRVWIDPPTLPPSSEAGQMSLFRANFDSIRIPADPDQKIIERQFMISSEATKAVLPPGGVQVFGAIVHMHQRGVRSTVKLIRDGVHISNVYQTKSYDFALQTPLCGLWKLLPGDALVVSCFYKPMTDHDVVGGLGTSDEMCDFYFGHATEVKEFNFGIGFMVEPNRPFLNCSMGTTEHGISPEEVGYSQAQYAPDTRDFVPLKDFRRNICDLVVRDEIGVSRVGWSSTEIPAQTYMLATIGLATIASILISRFAKIDDIRKKRNTVVYAVQLIFSLAALPVILFYLIDIWDPLQAFDVAHSKTITPAVVFIISQSILYLLEVTYRIDIRPEVLFHHLLTSGIVMFLCWVSMETLNLLILKLGLILVLMAVTEQPMYVALLLKNVGYGDRKWWPKLCRFAGWFFILTKLVFIALAFLTLIQGHTGKDVSWTVGSHSFSDWNSDDSVSITSTTLIVVMSFALTALLVAQFMVGRVLLLLASKAHAKLKASSRANTNDTKEAESDCESLPETMVDKQDGDEDGSLARV